MSQFATQTFDLAVQHHRAGRLREAEQLYRLVLAREPAHLNAIYYLGLVAYELGRNDVAADSIRRVVSARPDFAEAWCNLGNALKAQGQLDEAIIMYRKAIALNPALAAAHSNLGHVLKEKGRLDDAMIACRQAVALMPSLADAHNNLANTLVAKGRLDEAITVYQKAIALRPGFAEAYNNLGHALVEKGQYDEAIAALRKAIATDSKLAQAYGNLGNALKGNGQLQEAVVAYRHAIALVPNLFEMHCALGNVMQDQGLFGDAIIAYRRAIALHPDLPDSHNSLGTALKAQGQLNEAIAAYRQAIFLRPDLAEAYNNLANALADGGQLDEAAAVYFQAIVLSPNLPQAYNNLGVVLKQKGCYEEAIAAYRRAIALQPIFSEAYANLGSALKDQGQIDEAIASSRAALALNPDSPEGHNNLGNALAAQGELDQAVAAYRHAIALRPGYATAHSNLIFTLHHHPALDGKTIHDELRLWNERHAQPLKTFIQPLTNNHNADRPLRIGYVSADLREHPVGRHLCPVFFSHDHDRFPIFTYADVPRPDHVTGLLRGRADQWRSTLGLTDEQLAQMIRDDEIDILVDLSLHTAHNRLSVFARKPAPVQVTWLGYPGSTGLATMDYRLTDPYLDPPGPDQTVYSEESVCLPNSFWCYDPLDDREIPVNSLPALAADIVTFGCLNNFCKINDSVLTLWAKVLGSVAHSRLLLLSPEGSHRQRTVDRLRRQGIGPQRVEFVARQSRQEYLKLYHHIDLVLDTFPYNGHTTSLDSLWMGVPVVTLTGQTAVGRGGASILSNAGLPQLIAQTPGRYVQIAMELANDLPRLAELRQTLRSRMLASPLMDAPRFARNLEAAYRQMWRKRCEKIAAKNS
jgi:protein O-GlcNAc transferase